MAYHKGEYLMTVHRNKNKAKINTTDKTRETKS